MYISNVNSASVKLTSITTQQLPANEHHKIASEDLLIFYVNKGAGICHSEYEQHEIKKRDVIILNPGTTITLDPIRKIDWICIALSGVVFTSWQEANSSSQLFVASHPNPTLKYYLDLALIEESNRFRGSDLIMKKLIECVMIHLLRHNELSIKDASLQAKHNEIDVLQNYIRKNYSKKITLEELSDLVDINKYYLIRLFKQQTGLSPIDYLIHVRLEEAEKLLAKSNITVSDISDRVGFHSPSHFSKTFKENNHCTPSQYRKRYSANTVPL